MKGVSNKSTAAAPSDSNNFLRVLSVYTGRSARPFSKEKMPVFSATARFLAGCSASLVSISRLRFSAAAALSFSSLR